jgi:hypothetical protein
LLLEQLTAKKKKIRRDIKSWNAAFELANNHPPDKGDKKVLARDMYEDYNCTSTSIKIRKRKLEKILKALNISLENFILTYSLSDMH